MKLCSQCEFIYEDDQERCDMDGGQLVYEPTLEHAFPNNALQARTELERRGPISKSPAEGRGSRQTAGAEEGVTGSAEQQQLLLSCRLLPPTADSVQQPAASIAQLRGWSNRSKLASQIAAVAVLAVVSFMAFYAISRVFQTKPQTAKNTIETQKARREISTMSPIVSNTPVTNEKSETRETKLDASRSSTEPETRNLKRETAFPALPGLKPLPRLKPLPTLKSIPRLSDQGVAVNAYRKALGVNTRESAKKDSRFGSFLKKTGRILTKPFKSSVVNRKS
ncbi:MAG: hypothetical protein QOF62_1870 [Pyrinomonadaceae bacterium]|jgi:hypothetical protein|nr:hypothetical protein [Pyrinomonadaceae bacterium]